VAAPDVSKFGQPGLFTPTIHEVNRRLKALADGSNGVITFCDCESVFLAPGGTSIVPSTKKVGPVGSRIDIPLTHIEWSYVGSHYDAIEVGVPDGPRENEMVLILAMATTGRVHARLASGFSLEDRGKPGVPA
jgi:hypothetical protein